MNPDFDFSRFSLAMIIVCPMYTNMNIHLFICLYCVIVLLLCSEHNMRGCFNSDCHIITVLLARITEAKKTIGKYEGAGVFNHVILK